MLRRHGAAFLAGVSLCRCSQQHPSYSLWRHFRQRGRSSCSPYCTNSSPEHIANEAVTETSSTQPNTPRVSCINIEMLPPRLHQQIFKRTDHEHLLQTDKDVLTRVNHHLKDHSVGGKIDVEQLHQEPSDDLILPPLHGNNIDEHFRHLATKQSAPYRDLAEQLASRSLPPQPKQWAYQAGWTRYDSDGSAHPVAYPNDPGLVFDVEVLMCEGQYPTMATAASPQAWYSWCSERLINPQSSRESDQVLLKDLIAMETVQHGDMPSSWQPRLVIGHNVGFDRSFIKEQYFLEATRMRFLDTMSLHICVCGMTSFQRMLFMAKRKGSKRQEVVERNKKKQMLGLATDEEDPGRWMESSSLNNLNDVYQLHCKAPALHKAKRDVFINGNMQEVRDDFQELMKYCAGDVSATHTLFQALWPQYKERFPHPVSFAGMLEMLTAYLPVTSTWGRYKQQAQTTFEELQAQAKGHLMKLADEACTFQHGDKYRNDPWLWDLDWSVKPFRNSVKAKKLAAKKQDQCDSPEQRVQHVVEVAKANTGKVRPNLPGYPKWYVELCPTAKEVDQGLHIPGPSKISTLKRVVPKLLRLTWLGYPLHYDSTHKWGYLVPGKDSAEDEAHIAECQQEGTPVFPLKAALDVCKPVLIQSISDIEISREEFQHLHDYMSQRGLTDDDSRKLWMKLQPRDEEEWTERKPRYYKVIQDGPHWHQGNGPYPDVNIMGCWFFKIPHKDGEQKCVGNPLSKDFIARIDDGTLKCTTGSQADVVAKISKTCIYWKNNKERIEGQMVVQLTDEDLPEIVTSDAEYTDQPYLGAILPRLVPAGTITRRAVEPTWLTASNSYVDRVGSELKSMVNSPPGYRFVGADVDSQELWIAAVLADSYYAGLHGCTAFSWMTLQGNKADGTDLHSQTAKIMGITRDQSKVFNYGRIYGAGQAFAKQLLGQFNHQLSDQEVKSKVIAMFNFTKGKKRRIHWAPEELDEEPESQYKATYWEGGSESALFNKLEMIAAEEHPRTPVLGCQISKSLEPANVKGDFMTSRINWVIQSSAVDYLHLMLVCMRWLAEDYGIQARFCISIHDEVRYLVANEDAYRAALALQITNLLTRSIFAHNLNMPDLPKSVAFFSSVDIDTCLRKEPHMDCVTPSNPHGMQKGYGINPGESLTINDIMKKTNGTLEKDTSDDSDQEAACTA